MKIGNINIGQDFPPFIIAEMSGNHNQSLERALTIVDKAAEAGCHALKLQTYTADTMTIDIDEGDFVVTSPLWKGQSLYKLYQLAYTPWDWHQPIFERAKKHGMLAFSTPFDESAVDFLCSLDVPAFKIASFENTDLPLIKKIASKKKPVIVSTGMASLADIEDIVSTIRSSNNNDIILLKCTSTYPASPENTNLRTIPHLREMHNVEVGLSDHTMGCGVAVASIAFGARVIEKHFCLSRAEGGVDSAFSLEPQEMKLLVEEVSRAFHGLGKVCYQPSAGEIENMKYRRSIFVVRDIRKGEPLTSENIRVIRPSTGLAPKFYDSVLGQHAREDLKRGTPLKWELIC